MITRVLVSNNQNRIELYTGEDVEDRVNEQLICECGCSEFTIYQGSYMTVVKCNDCNFEYCVHEG